MFDRICPALDCIETKLARKYMAEIEGYMAMAFSKGLNGGMFLNMLIDLYGEEASHIAAPSSPWADWEGLCPDNANIARMLFNRASRHL
ncbi:MAG: hypothetical protein LBT92_00645 [Rickettsiales bacterium]|jgi:hypothetical protein|nr:hypothetical protein [Rickettsiales bacterium]